MEESKELFKPYLSNSKTILYFIDPSGVQHKVYVKDILEVRVVSRPYDSHDINSMFHKDCELCTVDSKGWVKNVYKIWDAEHAIIIGKLLNELMREESKNESK